MKNKLVLSDCSQSTAPPSSLNGRRPFWELGLPRPYSRPQSRGQGREK